MIRVREVEYVRSAYASIVGGCGESADYAVLEGATVKSPVNVNVVVRTEIGIQSYP